MKTTVKLFAVALYFVFQTGCSDPTTLKTMESAQDSVKVDSAKTEPVKTGSDTAKAAASDTIKSK